MIDISVIVVSYKGLERLRNCLGSLRFSGTSFTHEVIVVDNNPSHDEISGLRKEFAEFAFLHNPVNGGFANGSNLGAARASGRYLLFLNPDTVASEKALSAMTAFAAKNPEYGIISCSQFNEKGRKSKVAGEFPSIRNITGFMRAIIPHKRFQGKDPGNVILPDWVSGSVMLIPATVFLELKGFSEDFWMYYEDVDLCKRAAGSGYKIAILRDAEIEHNHGGSSRTDRYTAALTKSEVMISRHVYYARHSKGPGRAAIQAFMVLNNLLSTFIGAIAGAVFFPVGAVRVMILKNITGYYLNAIRSSTWLSRRSIIYSGRQSQDSSA